MTPFHRLNDAWGPKGFLGRRERVAEQGGDIKAFDGFVTDVHNTLEDVLGVP